MCLVKGAIWCCVHGPFRGSMNLVSLLSVVTELLLELMDALSGWGTHCQGNSDEAKDRQDDQAHESVARVEAFGL